MNVFRVCRINIFNEPNILLQFTFLDALIRRLRVLL